MPRRGGSRPLSDAGEGDSPGRGGRPAHESGYVVRASELGSYAYCHRQWWLRYVVGRAPTQAGQARLDRGTQRHAAHGSGLLRARLLRRAALLAFAVAVLAAVIWLLSSGLLP